MSTSLRLLRLMRPFRWQATLAVVLGTMMIASSMGLLGMSAYLIADATYRPLLVLLTIPIYVVRLASVTRAAARYAERMVSHSLTFRLLARLRTLVYQRLVPLTPAVLLRHRSGDLLTRLVADVDELQNLYVRMVSPAIVALLITGITTATFAVFSPLLAWAALIMMVLAGAGIPWLASLLDRRTGTRLLELRGQLNALLTDTIQGMPDVIACSAEDRFTGRINDLQSAIMREQRRSALVSAIEQALTDIMLSLSVWLVLLLAIPLVTQGIVGGVYLAFLALLLMASFEALQPLGEAFQFSGRALGAGTRLFAVIDAQPAVTDPAEAESPPASGTPVSLTFDGVTFTYPDEHEPALRDVSFTLPAGKRMALVGATGAGKSSVLHLIERAYDPERGAVLLAHRDIRRYALEDARAMLAVIDQDTYIFNNTIRANLRIGCPTATDDALWAALEHAGLADFVRDTPDGLDAWVGEQGQRLSGGERQRLAIARAMLKNAPVLLLDEPTANLDALTERVVLDALYRLMAGRTVLMATHRLIAMERMDEILVLDHGRIVEKGTHDALLEANGLYARLFEAQNAVLTDNLTGMEV